jgi:hypothetical protein
MAMSTLINEYFVWMLDLHLLEWCDGLWGLDIVWTRNINLFIIPQPSLNIKTQAWRNTGCASVWPQSILRKVFMNAGRQIGIKLRSIFSAEDPVELEPDLEFLYQIQILPQTQSVNTVNIEKFRSVSQGQCNRIKSFYCKMTKILLKLLSLSFYFIICFWTVISFYIGSKARVRSWFRNRIRFIPGVGLRSAWMDTKHYRIKIPLQVLTFLLTYWENLIFTLDIGNGIIPEQLDSSPWTFGLLADY